MVDSMGDPLHNVMHSMGTNLVTGWNTVCYTGTLRLPKIALDYLILVVGSPAWLPRNLEFTHIPDNPGYLKSVWVT